MIKSIISWILIFTLMVYLSGDWKSDLRNYRNILFVYDHSENIGFYWYIFVEVNLSLNYDVDFQATHWVLSNHLFGVYCCGLCLNYTNYSFSYQSILFNAWEWTNIKSKKKDPYLQFYSFVLCNCFLLIHDRWKYCCTNTHHFWIWIFKLL